MNFDWLYIFVPAFIGFLSVSWIYFKMLRIAHEKNLVDNPDARKLQKLPVPVVGGLSVFFGIVCAVLVASCMMDCSKIVPLLAAMSVMIYLGAMDDLIGLSPAVRFLFEIFIMLILIYGGGGCIDSLHGLWGIYDFSWWFAVPLTVVSGVGIINAINMIDGVNGLSSGLCITCCILFSFAFFEGRNFQTAMLCMTMAASLFPFLLHNVVGQKSKMFIGDAGTMSMGVLMAWCSMQMLRSDSTNTWISFHGHDLNILALTLAILSVPVFDTVRVMLMRICHGKSPFSPDKTHLHHMLYEYSHSHTLTSLTEIFIDLMICGMLCLSYLIGCSLDVQMYVVLLSSFAFICGLYFFMRRNYRLNTRFAYRMRKTMSKARQGDKSWWNSFVIWVDTPRMNYGIEEQKKEPTKQLTAPERRRWRWQLGKNKHLFF